MATQSLYRRYRPRRFSELKGQDHVVRALRTSVAEGREGQAYLFSGPRGTGKTTSARILAKVLNCTNPDGGEPCCECESCLAVERGTSYDVHELDAASNNGVEAMRDLIEKASLGTPGRHKVYILDEVHMLTKPAEAALLKTLEEPPPHVVFVLATTDPQKMSDTIRSRTQHLQFHLLAPDTLQAHVRWVADDAGLDVSDTALEQVLRQGAGSARDALSALELVASTGGEGAETVPLHEFVESMIEQDAGRALSMAAAAITLGRDPRTLTEELIGYLRNCFLSIMAPDLVQLPAQHVEELSQLAGRLGAAGLVRGIEQLGAALTEMRQAPDPRVLLDVAIVRLTAEQAESDIGALVTRITKLERQLAEGVPVAAPVDPGTGRATLGGRARRSEVAATSGGEAAQPVAADRPGDTKATSTKSTADAPPSAAHTPTPTVDSPATSGPASESHPDASSAAADAVAAASPDPDAGTMTRETWEETVRPALKGMARAVFAPAEYVQSTVTSLTLSLPNPVHRDKCEQHRADVEQALSRAVGTPVTLELVLGGDDGSSGGDAGRGDGGGSATPPAPSAGPDDGSGSAPNTGRPDTERADANQTDARQADASQADSNQADAAQTSASPAGTERSDSDTAAADPAGSGSADQQRADARPKESPRRAAERALAEQAAAAPEPPAAAPDLPADDDVDLSDLVDAPPENVKTPIDRLAEAFPGSEMVEEKY